MKFLAKLPLKARVAVLTALVTVGTTVPALATGESGSSSAKATLTTDMILDTMVDVGAAFVEFFGIFAAQPLFIFYLALGILSACTGLFIRMKRAARR